MTTDSRRPGGAAGIMDRLSERDTLDRLMDMVQASLAGQRLGPLIHVRQPHCQGQG